MLSNNNLLFITVSLYNDKISDKRIENLKNRISNDNLPLFIFYNNKTKYSEWNKAGCIFIKNLYLKSDSLFNNGRLLHEL